MRHRRISDMAEGPPPSAPTSVFDPEDDNVVPGEVVFALEADAAAEVDVSIANMPAAVAAEGRVTALGPTPVDEVLKRVKAQSVTRIHPPAPTEVVAGVAMASDLGLDTTMRVRYDGGESPAAVAKRLNKLDQVAWAEPNRWREASVVPNDPSFGAQWGLTRINCPDAWDHTVGDPSIVVAVVDTGVDLNHPELAPLLLPGQDLVDFPPGAVPKPGWVFEGDFTGVDANPQDEVGHGTHVAGTICSLSNNGVGVAGVAWNVRLLPVKVLARIRRLSDNRVSGSGSSAHIAAGIRWAVDHGARVINLSLGGSVETMVEREAVAYAVSNGVVVVAAMGNDNSNVEHYPAAFANVIAVGATDSADHRASFSNTGPWIDLAAPGVDIESTYWDDTYASLDGTSMATPHTSGVAALVLSRNSSLSAAQVGNILRSTAKPLKDNPADPVPNDQYGSGLVQAGAAVAAAAPVVKSRETIACPQSRAICQPSVVLASCPTRTFALCPSRQIVICQTTLTVRCPSVLVLCPSRPVALCHASGAIICEPPRSLADCPSLPCPTGEIDPGNPGPLETEWEAYDPHGYDPYQKQYE